MKCKARRQDQETKKTNEQSRRQRHDEIIIGVDLIEEDTVPVEISVGTKPGVVGAPRFKDRAKNTTVYILLLKGSAFLKSIPHICHGRHGRRLCKFFWAGVNVYRFNAKNWRFYRFNAKNWRFSV